jgi:hypothetical protein
MRLTIHVRRLVLLFYLESESLNLFSSGLQCRRNVIKRFYAEFGHPRNHATKMKMPEFRLINSDSSRLREPSHYVERGSVLVSAFGEAKRPKSRLEKERCGIAKAHATKMNFHECRFKSIT